MILQSRSSYESLNQIINYYQLSPAIINLHLYNLYLGSIYFNTFQYFNIALHHGSTKSMESYGFPRLPKASQPHHALGAFFCVFLGTAAGTAAPGRVLRR